MTDPTYTAADLEAVARAAIEAAAAECDLVKENAREFNIGQMALGASQSADQIRSLNPTIIALTVRTALTVDLDTLGESA